jgi:glycosyltransferase involved in cell wall biosynthesis
LRQTAHAMDHAPRRIALVHDFLLDVRGAERVFLAICDLWPEADVFTPVYDRRGTEGRFAHRNVTTSFLQAVRPTSRTFRPLLPFYPYAIESFDLRGYDLVVSSSSAWAHGVVVPEGATHVCYCHNPFRYAWTEREATLAARSPLTRVPLSVILSNWRRWDFHAAQHVDRYLANSHTTAERIRHAFRREAQVVYPPVQTSRFRPGEVAEHYLVVSELMPHKRIQVAIEAFNRLRLPLVIVGDGPEARQLRRLAGSTVTFTGRIADTEVEALMRSAKALVVTATEEFGIAAVEAQASGRPVIGLAAGGLRETIIEGETGTFYTRNDAAALAEAVRRFDPLEVDPQACVDNAERFGVERFGRELLAAVEDAREARTAEGLPERTGPRARLRQIRLGG